MIKRREREGKREKERLKERYREGWRDKRERERRRERRRERGKARMVNPTLRLMLSPNYVARACKKNRGAPTVPL